MKYLMITASLALALTVGSQALAATGDETSAGAPAASEQAGASSEATDAGSGEMVTRGAPGTPDQPPSEGTDWSSGGTGSSVEGFGPAQSGEKALETQPRGAQEKAKGQWQPGDEVDLPSVEQPGREESAVSGLERQTAIEGGREREMASGRGEGKSKAPGFSKLDKDKDGQLTMEEVQSAFEQADKDGDGRISRQEWQEAGHAKGEQGMREMGAEVPDTVSEQQGDPSAGAKEIPTVDPLAGQVPGTGEAK